MRSVLTVKFSVVILCLSQYLVNAELDINSKHPESKIEEFFKDKSDPCFTTRDYDNSISIPSVEVDNVPNNDAVVYGDQSDINEDDKVTQDEVVRKLRKEFDEKHKKTPAPGETKNEAPDPEYLTDTELKEMQDEFVKKHTNVFYPDGRVREETTITEAPFVPEDKIKEAKEEKHEMNLPNENDILKKHWKVPGHGQFREDNLKQHWNKESTEKINNGRKITLIPGEMDGEGFRHNSFEKKFHEEIYKDDTGMEGRNKIIAEKKDNVHKMVKLHQQLKKLLNFGNYDDNGKQENFMHYKKMMNIEMKQTTNEHQHDQLYGPSANWKKLPTDNMKKARECKNPIKNKRKKRDAKTTHAHTIKRKSKKTTKYFMDLDGRFRDIEEVEKERNEISHEIFNRPTPEWLNYDGYNAPITKVKFRPRPTLNYNRVPKEPLDYGSYDKSAHWRMLTELITGGTLPAKFYESLSLPALPETKEVFDVCRENFTTSECWRYPDLSRLRDTRERKFMKKYYNRDYPDQVDED